MGKNNQMKNERNHQAANLVQSITFDCQIKPSILIKIRAVFKLETFILLSSFNHQWMKRAVLDVCPML